MLPYINLFGNNLMTYTIFAIIGILVSGFFVCRQAKKRGHNDNDFIVFLLVCSAGVLIGGHFLYGITKFPILIELFANWSKYVTNFDDFLSCMAVVFGGSVFYGGLLGGMTAGIIFGKIKKYDLFEYSDISAPMIPLFHTFGRIGCFLGGCCYGIESEFGYTIHGNELLPMVNDVNRFPVQLMEAALNFGLFLLLAYFLKNDKFKGRLLAIYLLLYSIIRFFDEFLRGDIYRGFLFGLSTSQIISILLFIGSVTYLIIFNVKKKMVSLKSRDDQWSSET